MDMSEIKRQALVVGIDRYPFLKETPTSEPQHLTTAVRDARAIALILERYGDFEVRRLPRDVDDEWGDFNSDKSVAQNELQKAIIDLFCPQGEKQPDTALLYFAGRGLRCEKDGETEGFLATSDSNAIRNNIEPERIKWGISLKWLRKVLQESPVQQQVVWLDSSFSGEFTRVPLVEDGKQRCFIAASQANEDANAIVGGRGLLTNVLLKALNVEQHPNNEVITSHVLAKSLPKTLSEEGVTQHPVIANSRKAIVLTAQRRRSRTYSMEEHRLDRLWEDTDGWFSRNHQTMRHTFQLIPRDNDTIANYRQEVQTALGFEMPANWFQQENSCKHLHESLKSLCGDMFRGHKAAGDRSISVGAAYLIALMAHQEACHITQSLQISNWDELVNAPKSWIFPLLNKEGTAASAKALYDLFLNLFESDNQTSQVDSISFHPPGDRLVIKLTWSARVPREDNSESLSKWSCKLIKAENIAISDRANNTRAAILRLWRNMLGSQNGFMGPGIVYMEDKKLVVASVQV
jgi:hypothetical protein